MFATSSKELRKKEADEKEARVKRRQKTKNSKRQQASEAAKVKVKKIIAKSEAINTDDLNCNDNKGIKTTTQKKEKSSAKKKKNNSGGTKLQKSVLTKRLQQATARAKAAAEKAEQAEQQRQMQNSLMSTGDEKKRLRQQQNGSGSSSNTHGNDGNADKEGNTTDSGGHHLGTLSQLTKIIDMELLSATDGTATFNVHGTTNPPPGVTRDSMRSLLEENTAQWDKRQRQQQQQRHAGLSNNLNNLGILSNNAIDRKNNFHPMSPTQRNKVRHIAVIISKPLVQDQVTLEYACRLRALAKAIKSSNNDDERDSYEPTNMSSRGNIDGSDDDDIAMEEDERNYRPSIICFVGETSSGNLVSDADAGYIYFNHLCASNQISLEGIDIMLEKTTLGKGALKRVMRHLRQEYIPEWLQDDADLEQLSSEVTSKKRDDDDDDEEEEESEIQLKRRQQQAKKMQLHFTLFSCDYDLCRLNNIHHRSPQKSVLRPLLEAAEDDDTDNSPSSLITYSRSGAVTRIQDYNIDASWSYRYTSYPYIHVKDSMTSFLGKCYLLAEELTPVLANIRAVVDGVSCIFPLS